VAERSSEPCADSSLIGGRACRSAYFLQVLRELALREVFRELALRVLSE
jgi:hypothetical protein